MSFDHKGVADLQRHAESRLGWTGFNVLLILVGVVLLFNDVGGWQIITFGIFIFCPISIIRNMKQYYDIKQELNRYKNQFKND